MGCCHFKSFKQTCRNIIMEIKFIVIDIDKYMRLIDLETS